MTSDTKHCTKCGEEKTLGAFNRNPSAAGGLRNHCRACRAAAYAAYRNNNADKYAASQATYRAANRKVRATLRAENRPKLRSYRQARRAAGLQAMPKWVRQRDLELVEESRWAFAAMHGLDPHEVHLVHLIPLRAYGLIDGKRVRIASGLHCPDNLAWKIGGDNLRKGASLARALAGIDEPPTFET